MITSLTKDIVKDLCSGDYMETAIIGVLAPILLPMILFVYFTAYPFYLVGKFIVWTVMKVTHYEEEKNTTPRGRK